MAIKHHAKTVFLTKAGSSGYTKSRYKYVAINTGPNFLLLLSNLLSLKPAPPWSIFGLDRQCRSSPRRDSALKASRIMRLEAEPLVELDEFEAAVLDGDVDGGGIGVEAALNELLDDGDVHSKTSPAAIRKLDMSLMAAETAT
ncbi:hypothetical protein RJ639_042522 [Escallonia herrerae]|uniref:Uncharacterized protein n=1 Tax=Escallonia herrerae TaxID=1293975 RepID=A0AA88WQU3_9ASTE|nr:hypothetical protein RJ639_042522 [Escallonia herrerae]